MNPAIDGAVERRRSAADSLSGLAAEPRREPGALDLRRRITYLMFFRVVLISLVLGATTLLYWLASADLGTPSGLILFAIIGATYLLTLVYALLLGRNVDLERLAYGQLAADLVIATFLVHATGGPQSAYTFFFPLAIIGAASVVSRNGTIAIVLAATLLFLAVALLGWADVLPALPGQRFRPSDMTPIELSRSLGLNLAAILGVSVLAINLATQLQRTSASLASERSATADLLTLHGDIVRCLTSGLITIGPRDEVLTINLAAQEILGLGDQPGAPLERLLPGLGAKLANLGTSSTLNRAELVVRREGAADLVLGISVSPLASASGEFLGRVVNFQDLTEMRKMEEHFKRAERLAVVGSMAAGVAHEIRNPLASISGSVELLRSMPQADDDSRALMEIVTREIDRLNSLLTELLDYTNPRPRKLAPFNLSELVRDTLRVFEQDRAVSVKVALDDQTGATGVEIMADAAKLRQVLWNLLRNAAEATGKRDGSIEVGLSAREFGVQLTVRDDGPGMPPEHLTRIFDPFFTTKSKGHGLGLAIVQHIVSEHGGTIQVDSALGQGSSFTVRLPYTSGHVQ